MSRDAGNKALGELQEVILNCPAGQVVRCTGCHVKEPGSAFQMIGPLLVDCGEDCGWHPGGTYITLSQTMRNVIPFPFSFSPSNGSQIGRKSLPTLTLLIFLVNKGKEGLRLTGFDMHIRLRGNSIHHFVFIVLNVIITFCL